MGGGGVVVFGPLGGDQLRLSERAKGGKTNRLILVFFVPKIFLAASWRGEQ